MKVFVAAKWEEKAAARAMMAEVTAEGHTITHDWTQADPDQIHPDNMADFLRQCAMDDADGVLMCDVLVLLAHPNGRGMFVEEGIAIAKNIPVVVVKRELGENIYFHMPGHYLVDDNTDALLVLDKLEECMSAPAPEFRLASG
jgi:nucleoside 2-deoxyribosyltransferase